MKKQKKLLFGTDPEFFAVEVADGEASVIPPVAFRLDRGVPVLENGTHPIFKKYGDSIIHEDGVAFELSTPPSHDWRELWDRVHSIRESFGVDVLSHHSDFCLPQLFSLPTVNYQVNRWIDKGPEYFLCNLFGCDEDEDVYDTKAKHVVVDASRHPERYGGGHIHVSGLKEIEKSPLKAVRSMVLTAGLAATAYTDTPELDSRRVSLYGRPGKYRVQNYPDGTVGVEYRTPSNRWTENWSLADKIFTWAEIGMNNLLVGGLLNDIAKDVEKEAAKAISNFNQKDAKDILSLIESKL